MLRGGLSRQFLASLLLLNSGVSQGCSQQPHDARGAVVAAGEGGENEKDRFSHLDDGVLDGSGLGGENWYSWAGVVTFTFSAAVLGVLPTHAGVVFTDTGGGVQSFEAFDSNGISLGTIGPMAIYGAGVNGETAEDRFFGVIEPGGISAIKIGTTCCGLELDHLQYGAAVVPEPGSLLLLGSGLAGVGALARRLRRGSQ